PPSRLRVPVKPIVDEEEYTPGPSVSPPNNGSGVPGARPLRAVIAVLNSPWAKVAVAPPICTVPPDIVKLVGITPVTAVALQQAPTLPVITDPVPLMATPAPPRIAKLAKSLPRIGPAEALGAVVIWITAGAAAQRRNMPALLISFIDTPFSSFFFIINSPSVFRWFVCGYRLFSGISILAACTHQVYT